MLPRALLFNIVNALIFQVAWFVCILWGNPAAVLFAVPALILHFLKTPTRTADTVAVGVAVLIGLAHDLVLIHGGHIVFAESAVFPPFWLLCLWAMLGATLNHSMQWIYSRPLWSSLSGAIAGPLSYLAGVKLSAAYWSSPQLDILPIMAAIPLIAAMWLVVLPVHRALSLRILSYVVAKKTSLMS